MNKLIQLVLIMIVAIPAQLVVAEEIFGLNKTSAQVEINDKKAYMAKFRDEYQLLFVYTSKCPYCHKFSKILDAFSKDKKLYVAALTDDGGKIEPFTQAVHDRNRITELGVDGFPVLFVEHKKTHKTSLLADGLTPYSELERMIDAIAEKLYQD